jgi:hypothetical protein
MHKAVAHRACYAIKKTEYAEGTPAMSNNLAVVKKGNFSAKILLTLGVLSGANNSGEFYTVSDVVDHIINAASIAATREEFDKLSSIVSTVLCARNKAGHKGLYRTKKPITPRYATARWPHAKAGYGYRMGMPVQEKTIMNSDMMREVSELKNASRVSKDFQTIVKGAATPALTDMLLEITIEMNNRLMVEMEKAATATRKLDAVRKAQASIMETV